MNNPTFDDAISNGLPDDIFRVFFGIKVKFDTDVAEGDTGVREGKTTDTCFDDVLTEAAN